MTGAVLELNDHAINLYQDGDLVSSSPGFVLNLGGQTQFGQSAAEQSRLHPVNTHNEFWHRLSMTPLTRPLAHYRHNADIAHAHLMHIAETSDFEGDVVIAVPGSFTREQLAILGGVVGQSPFRAAAMMDAGVFYALSHMPGQTRLVFADLQLHQFSLTLLAEDQSRVRRESTAVVQGAGWSNVANALVQVINDAFIQQSRFNPQHSAFWEQHLYNELPDYLQQIRAGQGDFVVSITTDKTTHQARVSVADLVDSLQPVFRRITQQLQLLLGDSTAPVLMSERAAIIPGLEATLQVRRSPLSGEQMAQACVLANDGLARTGSDVPFISAWHLLAADAGHTAAPARDHATHILLDHVAYPLTAGDETVIKPASAAVLMEARAAAAGRALFAGDTLSVSDGAVLPLIRVHHGGA
ncbi:MAG: hypothetical protein CMQ34_15655 [Gammaproteobacteria bacterium]|nr:hypothetical protein [Gammaproteobacteria bacterium]